MTPSARPRHLLPLQLLLACRVIIGSGKRRVLLTVIFAVPVLLAAAGISVLTQATPTAEQRASDRMGSADGELHPRDAADATKAVASLTAAGTGAAFLPVIETYDFPIVFDGLTEAVQYRETDWTTTVTRGWEPLQAGRYPTRVDEIAVSQQFARTHDVGVASSVHARWSDRDATVVGIVRPSLAYEQEIVLGPPGQSLVWIDAEHRYEASFSQEWLVSDLNPVAHAQIAEAATGVGLQWQDRGSVTDGVSALQREPGIIAVPGLLLVVVGAAAAFILRIRRLLHELALLSAVGLASRTVLETCCLAGVIAGLLGAVIGGVAGTAVGRAVGPAVRALLGRDLAAPPIPWGPLLSLFLLSGVIGAIAIWYPARAAMRRSVTTRLAKAPNRPPRPRRRAMTAVGLVGLALISSAVLVNSQSTSSMLALIGSGGLGVALLAALPAALRIAARGSARAPIPVRLAIRSMARSPARPVAAVAIGVLAIASAVATLAILSSSAAQNVRTYVGSRHLDQVEIVLRHTTPTTAVQQAFGRALGAGAPVNLTKYLVQPQTGSASNRINTTQFYVMPAGGSDALPGQIQAVDGSGDFAAQTGRQPTAAETAALASGAVLVLSHDYETSTGKGSLQVIGAADETAPTQQLMDVQTSAPVDATTRTRAGAFVTTATAHRLGAEVEAQTMIGSPTSPADSRTVDVLAKYLEPLGIPATDYRIELGPRFPTPTLQYLLLALAGFAVFATTTISLAGSSAEMLPDLRRLRQLGFARRAGLAVIATQSVLMTAAATTFGLVLGLVLASARILPYRTAVVVPWGPLGAVVALILIFSAVLSLAITPRTTRVGRAVRIG